MMCQSSSSIWLAASKTCWSARSKARWTKVDMARGGAAAPLVKRCLIMPLHVEIITQERKVYDGEADMVNARGTEGEMGILPKHAPLVTALGFGEVKVRNGGTEELFAVGGGVLQVAHDHVIILA